MAYKNKTYTCFDGDTDMNYYHLMTAWSANENFGFEFYNAHDLNTARDSSQEESIKQQLRVRLANSKLFIVLIGEKTARLTKFVKWEMEAALRRDLPIIAVNLNGSRRMDSALCPPTIRGELAIHVPWGAKIMEYAMKNWPSSDAAHRKKGETGPYYYKESVYKELGL